MCTSGKTLCTKSVHGVKFQFFGGPIFVVFPTVSRNKLSKNTLFYKNSRNFAKFAKICKNLRKYFFGGEILGQIWAPGKPPGFWGGKIDAYIRENAGKKVPKSTFFAIPEKREISGVSTLNGVDLGRFWENSKFREISGNFGKIFFAHFGQNRCLHPGKRRKFRVFSDSKIFRKIGGFPDVDRGFGGRGKFGKFRQISEISEKFSGFLG